MITSKKLRYKLTRGPLLALAVALVSQTVICARTRDLTAAEGRELVMQALDPEAKKLPKLAIDLEDRKVPEFYEFVVTWDNPNGSVIVGFFAVNQRTGDVWRLVVCRRVESPGLRRLQDVIRRKVGLGRGDLIKLRSNAPCEP
jgi:hypothetical protein